MEKGIYDDNARFFAPYYSQAGLNVYILPVADRAQYLEIAYEDVSDAQNCDGDTDGSIRVFSKNETINLVCLLEGTFPKTGEEIAIDRMHADNAGISVGDEIGIGSEHFRVVGLLAYVNYSTLYEKNTDMMFEGLAAHTRDFSRELAAYFFAFL